MTMRALEQVGLGEGELGVRTQRLGPLFRANRRDRPSRTVTLRLYPPPPYPDNRQRRMMPDDWLRDAWAWVGEGLGPDDLVSLGMDNLVELQIPAGGVLGWWSQCRRAQALRAAVVAGNINSRYRGANADFMAREPTLALGGGGRSATDVELKALVEHFCDFARTRAGDLAQASVRVSPYHHFLGSHSLTPPGIVQPRTVAKACDELVFDADAWQLLGPGHAARLGGLPPGSIPLPGGGFELAIGELEDWLGEPERREAVAEHGRRLLGRCLATDAEAIAVLKAKKAAAPPHPPPTQQPGDL